MIVVKGSNVKFELTRPAGAPSATKNPHKIAGKVISLPAAYGIIHDPEGEHFDRCECFFGPYKSTQRKVEMTSKAKAYMGPSYPARFAVVDVPRGPWNSVGEVAQIFYRRPGRYSGKYFHPFKDGYAPTLSKCGRFYRLSLPGGCIVDDRGFVFP
jgi:hypothetical protein